MATKNLVAGVDDRLADHVEPLPSDTPLLATEALAAGTSIFELARVMGASVKTIDKHYGHLAPDFEQAIRARLDARAARSGVVAASDPNA